jgi:hypothetical protein
MLELLWTSASCGCLFSMFFPMLAPCDTGQIADVVVGCVAVDVMDVHSLGNRPVVINPNISVQPMTRPRKVPAVRWIAAFRVSVVLATVENH